MWITCNRKGDWAVKHSTPTGQRIREWAGRNGARLLLAAVSASLLIGIGFGKMTPSDALTSFASVVMAYFTIVLANLAREANIFTLWSQKHVMNPDLRVFARGGWTPSNHMAISEVDAEGKPANARVLVQWATDLVLWNTGAGTILVTGWDVDDEAGKLNLRIHTGPDKQGPVAPPLLVPSQGSVLLHVQTQTLCEGNATLRFTYATADDEARSLDVKIGRR
jgi:hypothetical protein